MLAPAAKGVKIYTIGHSNQTLANMLDVLKKYNIEVLVDVRSIPFSKYASQFNREKISQELISCGIEYIFAGDYLGGRPKDPSCYKKGEIPEGNSNYLKLVNYEEVAKRNWYKDCISRLVKIAINQPTAIMCSEEDPNRCHRHHLIAKTLLEMGMTVLHIRSEGHVDEAKFDWKMEKAAKNRSLFDFGVS